MNPEVLPKVTIVLLLRNNSISLALKKRGFGEGLWNGYGGKPEPEDKTIEETAIRETLQECGVRISRITRMGSLDFYFYDKPEWNQQAIVFKSADGQWSGEPEETEEMKPQWFKIKEIPYDKMWPSDKYWLPPILDGNFVNARILMDSTPNLLEVIINGKPVKL